MNRFLYLLPLLFTALFGAAQSPVKIYNEQENNAFNLYATNDLYCPVSLKLDLQLTNLQCQTACTDWVVVPARTAKHLLTTLTPAEPRKATRFNSSYRWVLGNIKNDSYDADHSYFLPFEKGNSFKVIQGYNGASSHRNQAALDFNMPEGAGITAAREGVVVKVVQHNNTSCPEERCKEFNNFVVVYHSDGTFAEYTHVKMNGALVQPGSVVKAGQLIAYSGNTGWSHGPHLHFMVYTFKESGINTLPTKFRHNAASVLLQPGETYSRTY